MGAQKQALFQSPKNKIITVNESRLSAIWVAATTAISGWQQTAYAAFTAVTQGILVAGTSVYANQLYTQAKKEA